MSTNPPIVYSSKNILPSNNISTTSGISKRLTAVETCMCGNKPEIGCEFYYQSKYSTTIVTGIVKEIHPSDIISMNGTSYYKCEITVKPLHIKRAETLEKLGI